MNFTTLLFAGGTFLAGVVVGVFLDEYGVLTADHLKKGGTAVVEKVRLCRSKMTRNSEQQN